MRFQRRLEKFIKENNVLYTWIKKGENYDVIIKPIEPLFDQFISLFSQSDLEGKQIRFDNGYFYMEMRSVLDGYGIELNEIFKED